MKIKKTTLAILCATALAAMNSAQGLVISTNTTSGVMVPDNDDLTINAGVTVQGATSPPGGGCGGPSDSGAVVFASFCGVITTGIIQNNGTVIGTATNGILLYRNDADIFDSIVNTGSVTGTNAIRIVLPTGITNGISNSGTLQGGSGAGVSFFGGGINAGGIVNLSTGLITSTSGSGIDLQNSNIVGGIGNAGTISTTGGTGSAISLSNGGSISGGITNQAGANITSAGGSGIFVDTGVTVNGGITNAGTITGSAGHALSLTNSSGAFTVSNSGAIVGDVNLGINRLDLNGASGTVAGAVSGNAGSIVNVGDGTTATTFTTGGTFTGITTFNVNSGGVLNDGHAIAAGTFNNAGTLAVAAGATQTITGNYVQTSSGANRGFQTSLTSGTNYGKLVVTGNADLSASSNIFVNVIGSPTIAVGTVLSDVIHADGTLTTGAINVTDNSFLFDLVGAQVGNSVNLTVRAASSGNSVTKAVQTIGNTPAQGAAAVLDTLIAGGASGDMGTVVTALGTLSNTAQVANAAQQTLPLLTAGMANATTSALHDIGRVVQARIEGASGLSTGEDAPANAFWAKPYGSWAGEGDVNNVSGYSASSYGMVIGADRQFGGPVRAGAAFAWGNTSVTGNSGSAPSSATIQTYQLIGYGSYSLDDVTDVNFQADFGTGQNDGSRVINFGGLNRVASSGYASYNGHVGAGIGRQYPLSEQTVLTPSVRADYTYIRAEGYTETGANALNLNVAGASTDEFILAADGKVSHQLDDKVTLLANLGFGYDTLAKASSITASYVGGGAAFATEGLKPSPWLLRGGLGVQMKSGMTEFSARYDIEARQSFTNQTASVKMRVLF